MPFRPRDIGRHAPQPRPHLAERSEAVVVQPLYQLDLCQHLRDIHSGGRTGRRVEHILRNVDLHAPRLRVIGRQVGGRYGDCVVRVSQAPLVRIVDLDRYPPFRVPPDRLQVLPDRIPEGSLRPAVEFAVPEDRNGPPGLSYRIDAHLGPAEEVAGPRIAPEEGMIAPSRRFEQRPHVLPAPHRHASRPTARRRHLVRPEEVLLGVLIGSDADDIAKPRLGYPPRILHRPLDGLEAEMVPEKGIGPAPPDAFDERPGEILPSPLLRAARQIPDHRLPALSAREHGIEEA